MMKYFNWIENNLNRYLSVQNDELSKSIVALYLLSVELSVNGAGIYLDRDSADYLPQVRRCFEKYSFQEGLDWIASLEDAYGMPIHLDVDSRTEYVMNSTEVQDRLDEFDRKNAVILRALIPKIDALLDQLVEEKLAEPPNWEQQ